jgi:hypothetical protein
VLYYPMRRRSLRRRLSIRCAKLARWLHIYLSMASLGAVLFFSVTGVTLNHPDWFFRDAERRTEVAGQIDLKWLRGSGTAASPAQADEPGPTGEVSRLEIVEYLRSAHGVRGSLAEFRVDEGECLVTFKGPGYAADAFIDRATGRYSMTATYHGLVALLNDLHKGRDTGPVWSLLIDAAAILMTLIAVTGLVLIFYLKLRRVTGVVVAVIGAIIVVGLYRLWVP